MDPKKKIKIRVNLNHNGQERLINWINTNEQPDILNFYIVRCPRQWGKSYIARLVLLKWAMENPGSKCVWITTTYSLAVNHFNELIKDLHHNENLLKINRGDYIITLPNKSEICFKSQTNYDAIRGFSANYAVLDEYSFWKKESYEVILKILRSIGKKCLITSTPFNRNEFFDVFQEGLNPNVLNYHSFSGTNEENPRFDEETFEQDRRRMTPNKFRTECLAEFIDDGGEVFQNIDACSTLTMYQSPISTEKYYCGVDVGRTIDNTVATILNSKKEVVFVYRKTGIPMLQQAQELIQVFGMYKPYVLMETNIEAAMFETIRKAYRTIESFTTTHQSKETIIEDLIYEFQNRTITLPTKQLCFDMNQELFMFEQKISKSKKITYGSRQGYHDDCVMSLALANYCYRQKRNYKRPSFGSMSTETNLTF